MNTQDYLNYYIDKIVEPMNSPLEIAATIIRRLYDELLLELMKPGYTHEAGNLVPQPTREITEKLNKRYEKIINFINVDYYNKSGVPDLFHKTGFLDYIKSLKDKYPKADEIYRAYHGI